MIFISYRRDDSAGYARALYDTLARRFGAERVFMDVDDLRGGQAFADVIRHAVGESKVLLVLIGRRWQGTDAAGRSRLDDPADFVHQEVLAGLQGGLRVVPVLLDGAAMPAAEVLPAPLQPLAGRHAVALGGADYEAGVQRLFGALDDLPAPKARRRAWIAGGLGLAAAAALAAWQWPRQPVRPPVDGEWEAEVEYDWPGARHRERFSFGGEGLRLEGSASFLGTPQRLLEGRVEPDGGLSFHTVTQEQMDGQVRSTTHRYRVRQQGDELHITMQTEGGFSTHVPVQFVARRAAR